MSRLPDVDRTPKPCLHPRVQHEHGDIRCYRLDRCRCLPCTLANSEENQRVSRLKAYNRWPDPMVPSLGSRRRLQTLMAAGWSVADVAGRIGSTRNMLWRLSQQRTVEADTARAITAVYDQLKDETPPETTKGERIVAARSRLYARRRGWLPPVWWEDDEFDDPSWHPSFAAGTPLPSHDDIDWVAVERTCEGSPPRRLTIAERREVVRRLHARGLPDNQIADLAHLADRTVLRIRGELGLPPVQAAA